MRTLLGKEAIMRWPGDAPEDVKALARKVIDVLRDHDADVVGPAIGMAFGFVILELGNGADDVAQVDRMMQDVRAIVLKYGAAIERYAQ
jgi:hypothetical protein